MPIQVFQAANSVETDYPGSEPEAAPALLHEFFERAARRWPDLIAIDAPPSETRPRRIIQYDELLRRTDGLANRLREFVTGECVVAILLERNSELIYLAQLAILKAGAAYTCIDPSFPDAQITTILDSRPVAALTDAAGIRRIRRVRPDATCLDMARVDSLSAPIEPLARPAWLTPRSLAYVIYTSGTTGRPKGVMVEHASVVNLVNGDRATFPVAPADRVAQNSSCAYDSSIEESWMALANGATLVVMDDEANRLGPDLLPWLQSERITIFCPPPTLLRSTGCDDPREHLPALRRIHVGGEALPADLAQRWAPGRCLVNDYGPTEAAIVAIRTVIAAGDPIAIGKPIPGMNAWVLNDQLDEVGVGETGELCLGGAGLARGYMNDPDMTARKFPQHPRLGRIYRTGDLAHCDETGTFFCHGRIDTQVKIRGYRIELEAIEAKLGDCPGVRTAACRVQGEGPQQQIVAFIVPESTEAPPRFDDLRAILCRSLPNYMVPSHFGYLASLPTSVSGKLDRRALPILDVHAPESCGHVVPPRDRMEEKLCTAVGKILGLCGVSVDQDFFTELGGDSLRAAGLISLLREDQSTARLTVRDLYEARTVAALAARARAKREGQSANRPLAERPAGRPLLATLAQTVWLMLGLVLGGSATYLLAFVALPELAHELGLVPFLLVSPLLLVASLIVYTGLALSLAVLTKKLLIGRYRPRREPVWGWFYVRNWMVQQVVRLIPWTLLEGTVFRNVALRALGARIGQRVHIHRGVDLTQGGWDLLDIGDDATIGQDVSLRLVDLEAGQIVVAPISLGAGSTVAVRGGIGGGAALEADAYLNPLSFLGSGTTIPRGECWDGILAAPADEAPDRPTIQDESPILSEYAHALVLLLARFLLALFVALPLELLALAAAATSTGNLDDLGDWIRAPSVSVGEILLGLGGLCLAVPLTLVLQCLAMRCLGRIPEGAIGRWSLTYIRVWLKTGILDSANGWLSGTLLWRVWLRAAGMRIGRNSEIGTILDTVPELVEIGSGTFFADGVYLAGPHVHRGTVTLARTRLGDGVFLGNHAVILSGQSIPDGVLLGVCTVADESLLRPGSSWFGHPPFELPNREVVEFDRSQTHEPSWIRYLNRLFWELLRFALPVAPVALAILWSAIVLQAETSYSLPLILLVIVPVLEIGYLAVLCLIVLALKWLLLGRVRPGMHPLWSCWCSRWDFHYLVWERYARGTLSALEGTLWLNWYLRGMGVRIGRGVVLGSGYAHVVDPDMLEFADGTTTSALFQAHTFEDRVLKIDRVMVGAGSTLGYAAVLLYGAEIGARTHVLPHSVVMKRERLLPDHSYAGCPTHLVE